ncbi:siderophore-iron reductase FhuF [Paracoccus cavernae]|uniref:siderophore-iron reductase FhuF n=1 Tax=Paracoccus cavernae TaxID=1571207 RepID=UPI0035F4C686
MMQPQEQVKLRALLGGEHDWMLPLLAEESDIRPALRCSRIADEAVLSPLIDRFAAHQPDSPRHALVSLWSQYYFATLCLPLMAQVLANGRDRIAVGDSAVVLDGEGKPAALRIAATQAVCAPCETPLDPLLCDHLVPVTRALAALGGISDKVIWGNAAHYLEWFIGWLESRGCLPEATMAGLSRFLERDRLPDGWANPLKGAIRYEGGRAVPELRRRKVCCLRYVIPGMVTCGGLCPRPEIRAQALCA